MLLLLQLLFLLHNWLLLWLALLLLLPPLLLRRPQLPSLLQLRPHLRTLPLTHTLPLRLPMLLAALSALPFCLAQWPNASFNPIHTTICSLRFMPMTLRLCTIHTLASLLLRRGRPTPLSTSWLLSLCMLGLLAARAHPVLSHQVPFPSGFSASLPLFYFCCPLRFFALPLGTLPLRCSFLLLLCQQGLASDPLQSLCMRLCLLLFVVCCQRNDILLIPRPRGQLPHFC
mmetsp:Transcript_20528/g.57234  ORF Transcript_20528/g.57234 Transcript_20528/m.57234 type:complete len:229 (-) Transcript_20528:327-1013(-)